MCMVILAVFSPSLLPRDARRSSTQGGGMFRSMDAYVLVIGLIAFGSMVSEGTMFDWSGVYFESVVQPGPGLVQMGYVAFMSTMALGRFTADRMVMRFGPVRVLRASGILIASGLLVSVLFPMLWSATLGFLLVGFGTSSIVPLCYSMAGKSKKMIPSVALASVSTIGFLGFLLGPPVIGHIAHASSLRWSFSLIALVGLGTAFIAPFLKSSGSLPEKGMKNSGLSVCQGEGNEHAGASINAADIAIIIYSEASCRQFFDFHDVVQENAAFHQFLISSPYETLLVGWA